MVQERKDDDLIHIYIYSGDDEGRTDLKDILEAELIGLADRTCLDLRLREEDIGLMFRFLA